MTINTPAFEYAFVRAARRDGRRRTARRLPPLALEAMVRMQQHPVWTWPGVWAGRARCSRSHYVVGVMIAAAMPRLGALFIVAVVIGFLATFIILVGPRRPKRRRKIPVVSLA